MARRLARTVLTVAFAALASQAQAQLTPPPPLATAYSPGEQRLMNEYQVMAKPQAFSDCDGYGAPTKSGDGMASYAYALGFFAGSGDQRRDTPTLSRNGVPACHVALQRLEAFPNYTLRRASLWRARAIHRLAAGEPDAALADLDLAEQALQGTPDPYHLRSLALGIDLIRSYALRIKGDQAGSERFALQALRARPYSRTTGFAAIIATGDDVTSETLEATVRVLAKVTPDALGQYYDEVFERGRYVEVVDLHRSLVPPVEHGDEPMEFRQKALLTQRNRIGAEAFWARANGQRAYALAALGRTEEARKAMAEAQARVAAAETPPPPLSAKPSTNELTIRATHEQGNLDLRQKVPPVLADWARLVEARVLLNEKKYQEALDRFEAKGAPLMPSSATIEFLVALSKAVPEFKVDEKRYRAELRKVRASEESKNLIAFFEYLPETETAKRVPRGGKLGGLLDWIDGYSAKPRDDGKPGMVITMAGISATAAMTQEAALLKAAELAIAEGKDSLLVLDDVDIQRTTINTYYGTAMSETPQGFLTRIEVVFLNAATLPPEFEGQRWRLLDALAVEAALRPVYRPSKTQTASPGAST